MTLGRAFFNHEVPGVPRHLWIIASNPQGGHVVIVNLSTKPSPTGGASDPPCRITPSEHRSLSRDSVVRCDHARLTTVAQLEQASKQNLLQVTADASPELVKNIQAALLSSSETPIEVKEVLTQQGFGTESMPESR